MVFLVLPEPSPRSSLSIKDVKDPKPLDTQEKLTLTHIVCTRVLSLFFADPSLCYFQGLTKSLPPP